MPNWTLLFLFLVPYASLLDVAISQTKCDPSPTIKMSKALKTLNYTQPTFDMCFGVPVQCFKIGLAFHRAYTYLYLENKEMDCSKPSFNPNLSSTFSSNNSDFYWTLNEEMVGGRISMDLPSFPGKDFLSVPFHFALVSNYTKPLAENITGYLSLLKFYHNRTLFNDESLSFLKYLQDTGVIGYQSFTLDLNDKGEGRLTFGKGSYAEVNEDNSCDSDMKKSFYSPYWECKCSSISLGLTTIATQQYVTFDIKENVIYAPYEYGMKLFEYLIDITNASSETKCKTMNSLGEWVVRCEMDTDFRKAEDITFGFVSNGKLILKWSNLFAKGIVDNDEAMISKIVLERDRTFWILGQPVFIDNIVLFDAEQKRIGFPFNKEISKPSYSPSCLGRFSLIYLYLVVLVLSLWGTILLIGKKILSISSKGLASINYS